MPAPVRLLGAVRVTARYRAPAGDGGLLAEPPLSEIGPLLEANAQRLDTSAVHLAGVPLPEFRRLAVAEVIEASRRYLAESGEPVPPGSDRLIVAGHQAEFFHPGVWIKKFVLAGQARRHGRAALNLIVDNDTVRETALRVPIVADDPKDVSAEAIPFDHFEGDVPYEEYRIADRGLFDTFPERLTALTRGWGYEPLAMPTWPAMRTAVDSGATLGEAVSRVRRIWERKWGVTNFELPVSRLAGTRAFAGFVQTILAELPRFADCYNAAIRAYREVNHLKSHNHPAPELARRDEWIEAPFWVWRADAPRRMKLFACRTESGIDLRSVGQASSLSGQAGSLSHNRLPTDAGAFHSTWVKLVADGWKIRPRAMTLTLFTRLGFADGFIHGIGGGKYDEVTDDIIRRFFHIEPPGYAVVSATVRLPIHRFSATLEDLHRAERRVRDLDWNPQRFPEPSRQLPELVFEKARLIEEKPIGKSKRREWFRQLQRVTRDLRPAVADQLQGAKVDEDRLRAELAANEILTNREYAWPLFPEAVLRDFFAPHR